MRPPCRGGRSCDARSTPHWHAPRAAQAACAPRGVAQLPRGEMRRGSTATATGTLRAATARRRAQAAQGRMSTFFLQPPRCSPPGRGAYTIGDVPKPKQRAGTLRSNTRHDGNFRSGEDVREHRNCCSPMPLMHRSGMGPTSAQRGMKWPTKPPPLDARHKPSAQCQAHWHNRRQPRSTKATGLHNELLRRRHRNFQHPCLRRFQT
mmetsp:Transcript_88115/g.247813  ORF Transcript_88115/g.247813 Transcript_88115/m.247813 type:complete len:206 (-) Transcript_88115:72-689(-)